MNAQLAVIPDEQHDRARFIGGSDIAAVLGISPWRTPLQLWERKTQPPSEERAARGAKKRGHRWEAVVGEMLVEHLEERGHRVEIVGTNTRYQDAALPFLAAEIDFEIRLDDEEDITNVELKTVHPFKTHEWGDAGADEAPIWYTAQAMHGLGVTGRRRCLIAPLFGADEIRAYPLVRDDETIAALRERAAFFWNHHVLTGLPPEPQSLKDLAALYPGKPDVTLIADAHLKGLALRLRAIQAEIKAREAEFDAVAFDVQRAMQDATTLIVDDEKAVTWKPRAHTWFDQAALKEQDPKLHRALQRKGTSRVFTVR